MNLGALHEKLALGTVQLGLPYGINNQSGQPDEHEAFQILTTAVKHHISLLDSADAYGRSLEVIGKYLKLTTHSSIRLISKFNGKNTRSVAAGIEQTLSTTGLTALDAFLYHRFEDYESGLFANELLTEKARGTIKRIGVSLYNEDQLQKVVDDDAITVIQLPFNPFDASLHKRNLLERAQSNGKEIHVRSVFFQGLFFKNPDTLSGNLVYFKPSLKAFHQTLSEFNVEPRIALLNYALHKSYINYVVIGVETAEQLEQNIASVSIDNMEELFHAIENIPIEDKALLNPANWKNHN